MFQEVGHAFLLLLPYAGAGVTGEAVKAFLRDRIADYKIPKTWDVLDACPFLPNGKVDKLALAARIKDAS